MSSAFCNFLVYLQFNSDFIFGFLIKLNDIKFLRWRMLGKIFGVICILSLLGGVILGNTADLSNAVIDGASGAVSLTISLCGIMSLWCGVMKVFERAGLIKKIAALLSPLLRIFFPSAYKSGEGIGEISANIAANLLGIGNAATPLALRAMEKLQKNNPDPLSASADMITLAVLNTASLNIIPTTIIALRRAAGSSSPYSIIPPILICSFSCSAMALVLCRFMSGVSYSRRERNG